MVSSRNEVRELHYRIERILKVVNNGVLTVEAGISDLIQLVSNPVLESNH
jgi:hypothetical protein